MSNKGKKKCPKCQKFRDIIFDFGDEGERVCPLCYLTVPCKDSVPKDMFVVMELKHPDMDGKKTIY